MANLFDYLEWRGDIPFSIDPFNEVDNLILSELAYLSYRDIVPPDNTEVPIRKVCEAFFARHERAEFLEMKTSAQKAAFLLEAAARAPRFREMTMYYYLSEFDPDTSKQFSAVTFGIGDGTTYAAFRGTDGTLVGWKEDLEMTYLSETESHRRAVRYLDQISDTGMLRTGGHSKGGNLAVYAAAFCKDQNRIINVYTNDSPGFREEVLQKQGYRNIIPKVTRLIPSSSVIGRLLYHKAEQQVVKSSASGLQQHDGFTWSVQRNRFERSKLTGLSGMVDDTLDGWLERTDDEEREFFIDNVFSLLASTDRSTFREIKERKFRAAMAVLGAAITAPKEKQVESLRIFDRLRQSSMETLSAYVNSRTGRSTAEKEAPEEPESSENSVREEPSGETGELPKE